MSNVHCISINDFTRNTNNKCVIYTTVLDKDLKQRTLTLSFEPRFCGFVLRDARKM